jgi:hypothetical protein
LSLKTAFGTGFCWVSPTGCGDVIGRVGSVLRKVDRVGHLVRHLFDRQRNAHAVQKLDNPKMEVGNRLRFEPYRPFVATAGAGEQAMADKVEVDLGCTTISIFLNG